MECRFACVPFLPHGSSRRPNDFDRVIWPAGCHGQNKSYVHFTQVSLTCLMELSWNLPFCPSVCSLQPSSPSTSLASNVRSGAETKRWKHEKPNTRAPSCSGPISRRWRAASSTSERAGPCASLHAFDGAQSPPSGRHGRWQDLLKATA